MTISNRCSGPAYRVDPTAGSLSATYAAAAFAHARRDEATTAPVRGWREPVAPVTIDEPVAASPVPAALWRTAVAATAAIFTLTR